MPSDLLYKRAPGAAVDFTVFRTILIVLIAQTTLTTLFARNVKQVGRCSAARTLSCVLQIHARPWIALSRGRLVFASNAVRGATSPAAWSLPAM